MTIRRLAVLLGVLVLLPANLLPLRAEDKADDSKAAFQKIKNEYSQAFNEFLKEYRVAKTDAERQALIAKKLPKAPDYAPRVLKLVNADPKSSESLDMLIWVVRTLRPDDNKAFDLLSMYHTKDKKLLWFVRC